MTEEQAKEMILILKEIHQDISDIKLEMKKQKEEIEDIKYIVKRMLE